MKLPLKPHTSAKEILETILKLYGLKRTKALKTRLSKNILQSRPTNIL